MTSTHDTGKVALITGANKGLGFETARQLGQHGITVLVGSRDEQRDQQAVDRLRAEGINAQGLVLDVTRQTTIDKASAEVDRQFGKLDILINNAGIVVQYGPPGEMEFSDLRKTLDTNLFGGFAVSKTFLPLVRKADAGRIVNVSSSLGSIHYLGDPEWRTVLPQTVAYSISKAALNAMTVLFANELRNTPIKVNAVCPGYAATDLNQFKGTKRPQDAVKVIVRHAMLPEDGPTGGFFNEEGPVPW